MREIERFVIRHIVDRRWREHLENMDYLRDGIHLRAMAQKDPLAEYRAEGHVMFVELNETIREEVVLTLFHAQLAPGDADDLAQPGGPNGQGPDGDFEYQHESLAGADAIAAAGTSSSTPVGRSGGAAVATQQRVTSEHEKLGRNDPCWCGSGKKFKRCHGA